MSSSGLTPSEVSNSSGNTRIKEVIVDSRINKVLAMRTDSVTMLEALDAISEFYVSNTVDARRALRQDLELNNIHLAKKFLQEFDQVKEKISDVENQSLQLQSASTALASRVMAADENMKIFMEKANSLEKRRIFYQQQSQEIQSFLSRFQLSNKEIELLYHANIDNPKEAKTFFEALQRLKTAYNDCKTMVEKHMYSVGFELLEALGQHQDIAYQHLFEWVKGKCESLTETGSTEDGDTNAKLSTAIRILKSLPLYFTQCQDLLISSRRTQLVQRFIMALTRGEPSALSGPSPDDISGSGRAIDLHAHDPVRYVGGMLAWMHQSIAGEQEFIDAIFGGDDDPSGDGTGREVDVGEMKCAEESTERVSSATQGFGQVELLARCLQGLGRPLRTRIMQTLETRLSGQLEILYSLTDLLSFYERTLYRIVPMENAVHSAVKGSLNECRRMFVQAVNKQAEALASSPATYPMDLKASMQARECANQMGEVLRVHAAALSPVLLDASDECHIDTVLANIIQPLLQSCRLGARQLPQAEMAIFMLNNISVMQSEIVEAAKRAKRDYDSSSSSWMELLHTETKTWTDILVNEEVVRSLKRSDMDKLVELIDVLPSGVCAVRQADLGQETVGSTMRAFYGSLFSTVAPQFERLQEPGVRERIRVQMSEKLANIHSKVYTFVMKTSNAYDTSILAHTPEEVRVLLGCETK